MSRKSERGNDWKESGGDMKLKSTAFYRPFSHDIGKYCLIPKSAYVVLAYPTRLVLSSLEDKGKEHILTFYIQGPVKNFTLLQDIDRGFVRIFGKSIEGHFSCRLFPEKKTVVFLVERCPEKGFFISYEGEKRLMERKEKLLLFFENAQLFQKPKPLEKLHLGCHKKQDITFIRKRLSLDEILPLWFALGQSYPLFSYENQGAAFLLKQCQQGLQAKKKEEIASQLLNLFCVCFRDLFMPRLIDTDHQGLLPKESKPLKGTPLFLLSEGALLIRRLFLDEKEDKIALLPCLPPSLHAGRLLGAKIGKEKGLTLDLEWSKKRLRRLFLRPTLNQTLTLELQKDIKSFRLRTHKRQKGTFFPKETPLSLKAHTCYLLDRFEK